MAGRDREKRETDVFLFFLSFLLTQFLNKISGNINLTFNDDKKSVLYTDINFNDSIINLDDIYDTGRYLPQDTDPILKDTVINYIKNSQWYPTKLKDPNTYYIPLYMKLIPL